MTLRERLGFATAVFGQNLVYTWFSLYLLVYLYDGLGLSRGAIATLTVILTLVRVWDAVNDIVIGFLVDRTRTRWGTFRPYIIGTAVPVALLTWGIFSIPDTSERTQLVLVTLAYLVFDICYTACDVPMWSLTGVITTDEASRARLVSAARTAAILGLAVITVGGAPLAILMSGAEEPTAKGWGRAALLVSVVGMALYTLAFFATREKVPHRARPVPMRDALRQYATNRPLQMVLLSGVVAFGQMLIQVGGAVVATVVFGAVEVFTTLGGALIGGVAVGSLLSPLLLRRTTHKRLMLVALVGMAVTSLALLPVGYSSQWAVAGVFLVNGVFNGFYVVSQTLLIADTADFAEVRHGERVDGASFAGLTFITKLGTALATLAFGLAVGSVGYEKGISVGPEMRDALWLWMAVVPALSCALAVLPLRWYHVPEEELPRLLRERRASRRAEQSGGHE